MQTESPADRTSVRYERDDKPPPALVFGLGLQFTVLCIAGVVLTPAIVIRVAGGSENYVSGRCGLPHAHDVFPTQQEGQANPVNPIPIPSLI